MLLVVAFVSLAVQDVNALRREILPTAEEQAWLRIPWMTDLWEARKAASEKAKPLFLWEMDGHPLGCT